MTAPDCEKIQELLPLYVEKELSEEETELIRKHLENCEECQKEYAFFASMLENLSSMPEPELSEGFHENLMRKVRAKAPLKKTYYFNVKRIAGFAAAAAVIAFSIVSFMNLEKANEQSKNPDVYLTAPAQKEAPQAEETKNPITKEEPVVPRKTSVPKTYVGEKEAQSEGGVPFSKAREIQEVPSAQASSAPAMAQTEGIAAYTEESFVCTTVTVSEKDKAIAEVILSDFEKNDTGYVVGELLEKVLARLSVLDGYTAETEQSEIFKENIIILK